MLVRASSSRTTSRLGASMTPLSAPPASIGKRTAPPPTVKLVTRSGDFAARKSAAAVPTSGPTTCGAPRLHSSIRRARNAPAVSGAISSGRPSEWPNPGMSMATTRPTEETRSQMRRKAQRVSGHAASSSTVTSELALVSANRTRTPSQTRKYVEMGEPASSTALLLTGQRGACGCRDVGIRVRVPGNSPTALWRLGQEDPGPPAEARVARGGRNDLGQLLHHSELLVAVEDTDRGEHLDAHVVAVACDVGDGSCVQVVDERRGVVREQRQVGNLLPAHHCGRQVSGERVPVREGSLGRVHVDHRHQRAAAALTDAAAFST